MIRNFVFWCTLIISLVFLFLRVIWSSGDPYHYHHVKSNFLFPLVIELEFVSTKVITGLYSCFSLLLFNSSVERERETSRLRHPIYQKFSTPEGNVLLLSIIAQFSGRSSLAWLLTTFIVNCLVPSWSLLLPLPLYVSNMFFSNEKAKVCFAQNLLLSTNLPFYFMDNTIITYTHKT